MEPRKTKSAALTRNDSGCQLHRDLYNQPDEPNFLQRLTRSFAPSPRASNRTQVSRSSTFDLWGPRKPLNPAADGSTEDAVKTSPQNQDLLIQPDIWRTGRDASLYLLEKKTSDGQKYPWKVVLNLAALQRIALQDLQDKIVVHVAALKTDSAVCVSKEDSSLIIDLLHKYTAGVRDLEYMQECAKRDFDRDPFLMMTSRQLEQQSMKRAGLLPDAWDQILEIPVDHGDPAIFASTPYRHHANQAAKKGLLLVRLFMALFGGFALVVPMLIMVLVPGQTVSLYVSSVFTIAFAIVLAICSDLGPDNILGATAAYAAVLVVFVGASQPALQG